MIGWFFHSNNYLERIHMAEDQNPETMGHEVPETSPAERLDSIFEKYESSMAESMTEFREGVRGAVVELLAEKDESHRLQMEQMQENHQRDIADLERRIANLEGKPATAEKPLLSPTEPHPVVPEKAEPFDYAPEVDEEEAVVAAEADQGEYKTTVGEPGSYGGKPVGDHVEKKHPSFWRRTGKRVAVGGAVATVAVASGLAIGTGGKSGEKNAIPAISKAEGDGNSAPEKAKDLVASSYSAEVLKAQNWSLDQVQDRLGEIANSQQALQQLEQRQVGHDGSRFVSGLDNSLTVEELRNNPELGMYAVAMAAADSKDLQGYLNEANGRPYNAELGGGDHLQEFIQKMATAKSVRVVGIEGPGTNLGVADTNGDGEGDQFVGSPDNFHNNAVLIEMADGNELLVKIESASNSELICLNLIVKFQGKEVPVIVTFPRPGRPTSPPTPPTAQKQVFPLQQHRGQVLNNNPAKPDGTHHAESVQGGGHGGDQGVNGGEGNASGSDSSGNTNAGGGEVHQNEGGSSGSSGGF
jgi:hypothetical protein